MYHRMSLDGNYFVYFWTSENIAINNDKPGRVFGEPFRVTENNCIDWRIISRKDMIAPELLTYWSIENENT